MRLMPESSDSSEGASEFDVPSKDSDVESGGWLNPSPILEWAPELESSGSASHQWYVTIRELPRRVGMDSTSIRLPSQNRLVVGTRSRQPSGCDVSPGFSRPVHRLVAALAPEIYDRVVDWPELRGVRLALRIYRFASAEERGLELVRIELRIPGISVDDRFRMLRTFRTDIDRYLDQAGEGLAPGIDRRLFRALRGSVSLVIAG